MSSNVAHRMDLVGMKYIHSMPYFDELPPGFIRCTDFKVFFRLKKHKRTVKKENLEKYIGMEFITFSPTSGRYWYRDVWEMTDMRKLYRYFMDGNIYVTADARVPEDEESLIY